MKRTTLVLTLQLPQNWRTALPRVGLMFPRVVGWRPAYSAAYVICSAPGEGYGGCVRSLAFNLGSPVLMRREDETDARLVFPERTHPADGAVLSTNGS